MIMMRPGRLLAAGLLCTGFVASAGTASALTLVFDSWDCAECLINPTVTISDNGEFDVSVGWPEIGSLTAFYADLDPNIEESDIMLLTHDSGTSLDILAFANGGDVGVSGGSVLHPSLNLTGLTTDGFDFGFSFDINSSLGALSLLEFLVSLTPCDCELGLANWTRIGLRYMSVGADGEGSDKLISSNGFIIPLPAALPMFLLVLGGTALVARRRRGVSSATA